MGIGVWLSGIEFEVGVGLFIWRRVMRWNWWNGVFRLLRVGVEILFNNYMGEIVI